MQGLLVMDCIPMVPVSSLASISAAAIKLVKWEKWWLSVLVFLLLASLVYIWCYHTGLMKFEAGNVTCSVWVPAACLALFLTGSLICQIPKCHIWSLDRPGNKVQTYRLLLLYIC